LTDGTARCSVGRVTIAEFMLALATDEELRREYLADAEGAARKRGLDPNQLRLLQSGDLVGIRVEVTVELDVSGERVAFSTVHGVTVHLEPGEEPPPSGS
jgi:hypothetical protein